MKAASDLYMPISAEILEKNSTLVDTPSNINESPFDKGIAIESSGGFFLLFELGLKNVCKNMCQKITFLIKNIIN